MIVKEGEGMVAARVVRRSLGPDGNVVDSFNHDKKFGLKVL